MPLSDDICGVQDGIRFHAFLWKLSDSKHADSYTLVPEATLASWKETLFKVYDKTVELYSGQRLDCDLQHDDCRYLGDVWWKHLRSFVELLQADIRSETVDGFSLLGLYQFRWKHQLGWSLDMEIFHSIADRSLFLPPPTSVGRSAFQQWRFVIAGEWCHHWLKAGDSIRFGSVNLGWLSVLTHLYLCAVLIRLIWWSDIDTLWLCCALFHE